jgi:thiamine-phosphate pyrophosphorylase
MVILREKDLPEAEYEKLAAEVSEICKRKEKLFCINSFIDVAKIVPCDAVQLSFDTFRQYRSAGDSLHCQIGISVHSVEEAVKTEALGADYLIAGHIFPTASKEGVPPRGLAFLRSVVNVVRLPVYAIGGITEENAAEVYAAGAKGICMMSGMMRL